MLFHPEPHVCLGLRTASVKWNDGHFHRLLSQLVLTLHACYPKKVERKLESSQKREVSLFLPLTFICCVSFT